MYYKAKILEFGIDELLIQIKEVMAERIPLGADNDPNAPWNQTDAPFCYDCDCYMDELERNRIKVNRKYIIRVTYKCPHCGKEETQSE